MNGQCKDCRWWIFEGEELLDNGSMANYGVCHRFPKSICDGCAMGLATMGDDFCGEFKVSPINMTMAITPNGS